MSKPLVNEALAAKTLKDALATDDSELLRDMVEGETDFFEAVEKVLRQMDDDSILVTGIRSRMTELEERKRRIEKRIDTARASLEAAMIVSECPPIETALGTVSLKKLPPSLNLIDEVRVPSEFWKRAEPKLDKCAVLAALKDGKSVTGASLTNGGMAIQIRMK